MFFIYTISLIGTAIFAYNLGISDERIEWLKLFENVLRNNRNVLLKYEDRDIKELHINEQKEVEKALWSVEIHTDIYNNIKNKFNL